MTYSIYKLAQLQAMTQEQLTEAFPQKHKAWVTRGYKVDIKRLIRAIILATKDLHYPLTENRGCREVWYNPVKPILYKADRKRIDDPKTNYMRYFEGILSDMVKEGLLTYADLGVNDFRTLRETYEAAEKAKCWKNILLFVEKDSAYIHLKPLQNLFNINIMSGSGWSNTAGIERLLRNLTEKGILEVAVFTLTDYDPFGFAIDHEFANKCETLGLYVSEHHRIGINVEHTTKEILNIQKYPIKRGRKLSVDGVCFDSERWLAEHGIDRLYGLEIEAVSAQPGGHQFLREIVAKELLKYLNETDRVNEITKFAWENLPYSVISKIMALIDNTWLGKAEIEYAIANAEGFLPTKYLSYEEYRKQYGPIFEAMETETYDVDSEIEGLEEQLEELRIEKETLEQPYRAEIKELQELYACSKLLLLKCLWQYYETNKEKWPREKYYLGYPPGCLVKAIQQQQDLGLFIKQVNTTKPSGDIANFLTDGLNNGEIAKRISEILGVPQP